MYIAFFYRILCRLINTDYFLSLIQYKRYEKKQLHMESATS